MTREQLLALGFDGSAILRRVRSGGLHRIHRGVYAAGHTHLDLSGRRLAAVLACGPGALLSHRHAADEWEILGAGGARIAVTVASYAGRVGPASVRLHRTGTLAAGDRATRGGLPLTSPERTLEDLAAVVTPGNLAVAADRAEKAGLLRRTIPDVPRPGAAALRAALARDPAASSTELELRLLSLIVSHRLPVPRRQAPIGPYTVDFLWSEQRVVAEADSFEHHSGRRSFAADRRRDAELTILGYDVVRFTWRQVVDEPRYVTDTLRRLLRRRPG